MKCKLKLFFHSKWIPEPKGTVYTHAEAVAQGRWYVCCFPGRVTAFGFIWEDDVSFGEHRDNTDNPVIEGVGDV